MKVKLVRDDDGDLWIAVNEGDFTLFEAELQPGANTQYIEDNYGITATTEVEF